MKLNKWVMASGSFAAVLTSAAAYANPVNDVVGKVGVELVRQSHIDGNVPTGDDNFSRLLSRDLDAYFSKNKNMTVRTRFELLRKLPTQVGLAYPKFYAWVKLCDQKSGVVIEQGVVRVAALDKAQFDVTHYLTAAEICKNPESIAEILPASLCADATERAQACLKGLR